MGSQGVSDMTEKLNWTELNFPTYTAKFLFLPSPSGLLLSQWLPFCHLRGWAMDSSWYFCVFLPSSPKPILCPLPMTTPVFLSLFGISVNLSLVKVLLLIHILLWIVTDSKYEWSLELFRKLLQNFDFLALLPKLPIRRHMGVLDVYIFE